MHFLPAFLFGCAAIISGNSDSLTLASPTPGTEWSVNGEPVAVGSSVAYQLPRKGNRGTVITASAPGCSPVEASVPTRFDPVTLLGILIDGGLLSVLIIDGAATGAWTKAATNRIYLEPVCPTF